jgi:hypothetical protein
MTALDEFKQRKRQAAARKREETKHDQRIERAYYAKCSGIQLDIMDIQRVFQCGRLAVAQGMNDEDLATCIRTFVDSIRKN